MSPHRPGSGQPLPPIDAALAAGAGAVPETTLRALCEAAELDRRLTGVQTARRLVEAAVAQGCEELAMRARLAEGDAMVRAGDVGGGAALLREVQAWATRSHEQFVLARSHFQLSIVAELEGDLAAAVEHACLSVDLLPEGAPAGVRARHLVTLALTVDDLSLGTGAPYYQEALDIAAATGDVALTLSVLSNVIWNELEVQDTEAAWALVQRMRQISERAGVALRAGDLETFALVELARGEPAAAERTLLPILTDPPGVVLTEAKSLPSALLVLARAQRLQGQHEAAQGSLDRCALLCGSAGLAGIALQVSEEQAQLYAAAGRFEDAYEQHRRFHADGLALLSAVRAEQAGLAQRAFAERETQREDHRYRELALRDALTGLYNRRFVDHQLPTLITRAQRDGSPLSVALVDVDFFKRVNDTLSHEVGDLVLQAVARLLAAAVDEPATASRLGGEEFLLVLPGTGSEQAAVTAEQLRRRVQDHDWAPLTGDLSLTISVGVTTVLAGASTQSALLQQADRNLYAAKRSGRNRVLGDPA